VPSIPPALQRVVQRCLEKSPQQRFHSASDLAFALEALSDTGSAPTGSPAASEVRTSRMWIAALGAGVAIAVALAFWRTRPPAVPVVESIAQLTNDGISKTGSIETDGSRIYFNEGPTGSLRIAQVSVNGGQTGEVATNLANPVLAGLTGDGSTLLVLMGAPVPTRFSVWSLPIPAGDARRLGDTEITDASVFPDGRLVYAAGSAVFVSDRDGSNPRKLEEISRYGLAPEVSPDGKRFVFSFENDKAHTWAIYEAASDGTGVHAVLQEGQGLPADAWCPRWTADGRHLLFLGKSEERWDLWALSDEKRFLGAPALPVQLTNGPISYSYFAAGRDGKRIFAIGAQRRGEVVHYDAKSQEFVPYLGGISAFDPTFSCDGKWVAYLSYPERTLWRSRADGSDRLQLTTETVRFRRIAPDGSKVAFSRAGAAYVTSMNGGTPKKVADHATAPDWSPDGTLLAVTDWDPATPSVYHSKLLDVRSGNVSTLPDSEGTLGPWFTTQDTLIAAAHEQSVLTLFDFKTRKWSDLVANPDKIVNWEASSDGKYFFYSTGGNNRKIFRMRLPDHRVEEVASLKNLRVVDDPFLTTYLSVGADDSPVVTRDIGTQEVYAISVKWP